MGGNLKNILSFNKISKKLSKGGEKIKVLRLGFNT